MRCQILRVAQDDGWDAAMLNTRIQKPKTGVAMRPRELQASDSNGKLRPLLRRLPLVTLLFTGGVLAVRNFADLLGYERVKVGQGEWYRLLTGHFVHWSGEHLVWDVAVFALLGILSERI